MRPLLVLSLLLLCPAPLGAAPPREMVEIRAGDPVTIRADRGYILVRQHRPEGVPSIEPAFLRVPTVAEVERYRAARREAYARAEPGLIRRREQQMQRAREAAAERRTYRGPIDPPPSLESFPFTPPDGPFNLQNIEDGRPLVRARPDSTFLIEVLPGDYVLYGATFGSGVFVDALHVCWCLGTVGFTVEPGVVTDIGVFFGDAVDRESSIPELRGESGFGPSSRAFMAPLGGGVRPPGSAEAPRPDVLRAVTVRPARYRAIGRFLDPRAMTINRLAPIPGILAYEDGRVIDVQSGQAVPDVHQAGGDAPERPIQP